MGWISRFIGRLLPSLQAHDAEHVEELRTAFRARYHQFKLLLNANNRALDMMAEMEMTLKGTQPFGMSFVMSRCTGVATCVWQIIKHLDDLAPKKYEELYDRFKEIQIQINPYLKHKIGLSSGPMVISLSQVNKELADLVGGKMANLGEILNRIRMRVPHGFVITASAYQHFISRNDLQVEINRQIQSADVERVDQLYSLSAAIQQMIIQASLPKDLEEAIYDQYQDLQSMEGQGMAVAMRSSAIGEDYSGTSFAGQYRSELNVNGENITQAYKEIVASKYSVPAMSYRLNRGMRDEDIAMCVGCMGMIEARSSGVMYTSNPVDIRDKSIVINAVWGLPKTVVDGSAASDLFIVSRGDPMEIKRREIPFKDEKYVCYPDEGVCRLEVTSDDGEKASLSDEEIVALARLGDQLEAYYGAPQDIEWAVDAKGNNVILQCRPLLQTTAHEFTELAGQDVSGKESIILEDGVTASPGVGSGPVFVVTRDMDALQFPEGAVLVATQSLPRWATLLNRSSAVVTEQGSVAGHLANVAREFGIPALFGVSDAAARLKGRQMITVDADGHRVYDGRIEVLLERKETPKNLMEGTPVYEALKGAARHIIPLNLLDPDAPSFRPVSCKTFHDITRFCHEKSVHEMFEFGKRHHFHERSSKQLLCEVPMQWWILNLDDGFREEVEGKYVHLENIVSIPMLAIWEGIVAFPWEGPPPMDGKGFMSVMFEATRNTALVPGVRSSYGNRNYFMISKNYCSLNSRLGFHFSMVETLVSERSSENYLSFQFKGGAADDLRRERRIRFIGEFLEAYDFRVDVKEDHLMARMEDREMDFMKTRLKIIGYLTIQTRQLDMIMANQTRVEYYRKKFHEEVQSFFKGSQQFA